MSRIYISPSQQSNNVGYGSYGTEQNRMFELGISLKSILERCGNTVFISKKGITYQAAAAESNALNCDLHLVLHSNAFNGSARGTIAMYASANGKKLATLIYNKLAAFTPTADRGCNENMSLYELTQTKAVAAYMEIAFHDNKDDATMIINNLDLIAELITKGTCEYLGIAFIEKKVVQATTGQGFRVVTGSYAVRANADARVEELKKAGFDSFIVII